MRFLAYVCETGPFLCWAGGDLLPRVEGRGFVWAYRKGQFPPLVMFPYITIPLIQHRYSVTLRANFNGSLTEGAVRVQSETDSDLRPGRYFRIAGSVGWCVRDGMQWPALDRPVQFVTYLVLAVQSIFT